MTVDTCQSDLEASTALGSTLSLVVCTMGDLAKALEADTTIPAAALKRWLADLKRLFELDATIRHARPLGIVVEPMLKRLHHLRAGLSRKRLDNIKSSARQAIQHHHDVRPGATARGGLRGPWAKAYALLPPPRNPARVNLSPLLQWAQMNGVLPEQITSETLKLYHAYLRDIRGELRPLNRLRMVVKHWNASAEIVGWPATMLSYDTPGRPERALKDATLGPRLVAELDTYIDVLRSGSPSGRKKSQFDIDENDGEDDKMRPKPLRETTLKNRRHLLRHAIGLYSSASSIPPNQIRLTDLVVRANARAIMEGYLAQLNNNSKAAALESMAYMLVSLGRYLKVDDQTQKFLGKIAKAAVEPAQKAAKARGSCLMTPKNRDRLEQLGPDQIKALMQLPARLLDKVVRRIRQGNATPADMVDAQVAVQVAILTEVPFRGTNMVAQEVGRTLILPPRDDLPTLVIFEADEVKNEVELRFELPPDVTALLRTYTAEIQPYFHRTRRTTFLFPGSGNAHKSVTHLGEQLLARVKKATGVHVNQNLFRHLGALQFLKRNPGNYEAVRRLLGHKKIETTIKFYCGLEIKALLATVTATMAVIKAEAGLDPKNAARLKDQPKRRRQTRATAEAKLSVRRAGYFTRGQDATVVKDQTMLCMPSASGQGLVGPG